MCSMPSRHNSGSPCTIYSLSRDCRCKNHCYIVTTASCISLGVPVERQPSHHEVCSVDQSRADNVKNTQTFFHCATSMTISCIGPLTLKCSYHWTSLCAKSYPFSTFTTNFGVMDKNHEVTFETIKRLILMTSK